MTLDEFVDLALVFRELDSQKVQMVLSNEADRCTRSELKTVAAWLSAVSERSGNDEQLADDVFGTLRYVNDALAAKGNE